jgi:hypothetical protein
MRLVVLTALAVFSLVMSTACEGGAACGTSDDCNDATKVCARTVRQDTCAPSGTCVDRAQEGEGCAGTDSFCGAAVDHPCERNLVCQPDATGSGCQGSTNDGSAFFSSCCVKPE